VGFPFERPFLDTLAVDYGAGVRLLDFATDPRRARTRINDWVAEATEQRVEELLPENSIDTHTRLVLANAIYFQARWSLPFDRADTTRAVFHLLGGGTASVPTMHGVLTGGATSGDGWTAVALPYLGSVTMGLLVPDKGRFAEIEGGFDAAFFERVLAGLATARITVALPRFSFHSAYDLVPVMRALGMNDATDFSAMSRAAPLVLAGIFHQSFVSVDEVGTEAAAATGMVAGATSLPPPVTLTVDRPFLFWIRDLPTGAVLFAGRVTDPR
jgi:serpin B